MAFNGYQQIIPGEYTLEEILQICVEFLDFRKLNAIFAARIDYLLEKIKKVQ